MAEAFGYLSLSIASIIAAILTSRLSPSRTWRCAISNSVSGRSLTRCFHALMVSVNLPSILSLVVIAHVVFFSLALGIS